jgi:integrase
VSPRKRAKTRQRVQTLGERGALVRVNEQRGKRNCYVVQWGSKASRQQRAFPLTKLGKQAALAFAEAFVAERGVQVLTTADLWARFQAARFPYLRANTKRIYTEGWTHWEKFFGAARDPQALKKVERVGFQQHLANDGLGINTARSAIRVVRTVYNWAEDQEIIAVNRWHGFKVDTPTGTEPIPRAEYRAEEFLRIWRELDPAHRWQWRAWAAIGLLGIYGNRQHALLALHWEWDTGDEIVIPASVEKTGKEAILPMFPLTRAILEVAKGWRAREGYDGPYVFFAGAARSTHGHYTIQSLTDALHRAEKNAGVPSIVGRAGHGFRRMLVGDIAESTGDVHLALQAIGDTMAMAKHYRVRRDDRLRAVLGERIARMVPETPVQGVTESATNPDFDSNRPSSSEG